MDWIRRTVELGRVVSGRGTWSLDADSQLRFADPGPTARLRRPISTVGYLLPIATPSAIREFYVCAVNGSKVLRSGLAGRLPAPSAR